MRALIVFVQVLVSLLLTASFMPIVLVTIPAAQEEGAGLAMMGGLFVVLLVLIMLVWPKRRKT